MILFCVSLKQIYKNIDFDFTVYYNQLLTGAMDEPIEGIVCAVYSPEEGVWHRAQVKHMILYTSVSIFSPKNDRRERLWVCSTMLG